jgi:hypothetical protein
MLHGVGLARTSDLEECVASIFNVERISVLGTTLAVSSLIILSTPMIEATRSSETILNKEHMAPHSRVWHSLDPIPWKTQIFEGYYNFSKTEE